MRSRRFGPTELVAPCTCALRPGRDISISRSDGLSAFPQVWASGTGTPVRSVQSTLSQDPLCREWFEAAAETEVASACSEPYGTDGRWGKRSPRPRVGGCGSCSSPCHSIRSMKRRASLPVLSPPLRESRVLSSQDKGLVAKVSTVVQRPRAGTRETKATMTVFTRCRLSPTIDGRLSLLHCKQHVLSARESQFEAVHLLSPWSSLLISRMRSFS